MFDITTYLSNILIASNIDNQIADYIGRYPNLFPQLNVWGGVNKTTRINLENQNRVDVRYLDEHLITRRIEPWKSITTWYIATVVLDNNIPIAILRRTDNREDRYADLLLLNKTEHHHAGSYLFTFVKADPGPELEIYDKIGTFSGDISPHILGVSSTRKYFDPSNSADKIYLNTVLDYTVTYNY